MCKWHPNLPPHPLAVPVRPLHHPFFGVPLRIPLDFHSVLSPTGRVAGACCQFPPPFFPVYFLFHTAAIPFEGIGPHPPLFFRTARADQDQRLTWNVSWNGPSPQFVVPVNIRRLVHGPFLCVPWFYFFVDSPVLAALRLSVGELPFFFSPFMCTDILIFSTSISLVTFSVGPGRGLSDSLKFALPFPFSWLFNSSLAHTGVGRN